MTRTIIPGTATDSDSPWFFRTPITCPKCGETFLLTSEDMQPLGGPYGASDTVWHWWRELVEGDPATAALDLSNHHLDPAQVAGPCPNCFFPIAVRGPHYGLPKTLDITTDPDVGDIAGYIAAGARFVLWFRLQELDGSTGRLVGLFATADSTVYGLDATGAYAPGVVRAGPNDLDAHYPYCLHQPGQAIPSEEARAADPDMVATLERMGLIV